ncbi:phospholipase A2 [Hypoxylon sp. NC1633]|nr:phospholipase A2 [Hypoxylon sp. NC1633]
MAQPENPPGADKWSSLLMRLNPVPTFAEYTGPYKVGTVDVEIPVSELNSPSPAPDNAAFIETVQFRIYYPAHPDAHGKRITWLPAPQREHLAAYIKFLGFKPLVSEAMSFLPRHLHYTSIPVIKNAALLEPNTPNGRWPTAIFSHGLGGSRNAYSQVVGSLASHGVVVICPEHRDGSAVASFIRIPSEQHRYFVRNTRRMVPYHRISHDATDEVYALRNDQLRIRLWELGLIHEAVLGIDKGVPLKNLNKSTPSLSPFIEQLHVHEPGSIIFAGHSFGSATMVQFLKTVFYAGHPKLEAMEEPLYTPSRESSICRQITPRNVTILLDMWILPLLSRTTKALRDLPLPVYADLPPTDTAPHKSPSPAPGGNALLAIESEDFYKWKEHLHESARLLSPDPTARRVQATAFYEDNASGVKLPEPHVFFVEQSAHLSQSDFGVLFPRLTRRVFGSEEPERALRLNRRAMLQVLRANGVPVARTWSGDLVDGAPVGKILVETLTAGSTTPAAAAAADVDAKTTAGEGEGGNGTGTAALSRENGAVSEATMVVDRSADDGIHDDRAILDRSGHGAVDAWRWIDIVGMGEVVVEDGEGDGEDIVVPAGEAAEAQEPDMAGVIEPNAAADEGVRSAAVAA